MKKIKHFFSKINFSIIWLLFLTLSLILSIYSLINTENFDRQLFFILIIAIDIIMFIFIIAINYIDKSYTKSPKKTDKYYEELMKNLFYNHEIKKIDENIADSKKKESLQDILVLMIENMKEINEYFSISKNQARHSFIISIIFCLIGLSLFGLSIIFGFVFNNIEPVIITTIGGVITEIYAGTILIIYKKSLFQLNHYYDALHENEIFLSSVNIVNKISIDKQDDVYIEIIKSNLKRLEK